MAKTPSEVILASASAVRARLLRNADVGFRVEAANIDESAIKRLARSRDWTTSECALALAEAKARHVAARHPTALVIGADQILALDGQWFDKPEDLAQAQEQLKKLRGRTHELVSAVCAVRAGQRLWHAVTVPRLTMRDFSGEFLDSYIASEGEEILGSVGGYRLEGRGVQLFGAVEGDYFSVLGLPLVELLDFLRTDGTLKT